MQQTPDTAASNSDVVVINPGDDLPGIIRRVVAAPSGSVSLLVNPDNPRMQQAATWEALVNALGLTGKQLLVLSSDRAVLGAASQSGLETMPVAAPPRRSTPNPRRTTPSPRRPPVPPADPFAETTPPPRRPRAASPPRPERPDRTHAERADRSRPRRSPNHTATTTSLATVPQAPEPSPWWRSPLIVVGGTVGIILSLLLLLLLLQDPVTSTAVSLPGFSPPPQVRVTLPAPPTEPIVRAGERLPVVDPAAPDTPGFLRAQVLETTTTGSATGQVTEERMVPATNAGGTVSLVNIGGQAINFPVGTLFVATNPAGESITFSSNEAFTLPGPTQTREGTQIITSLGQATVSVTATVPGSVGNVEANTISRVEIPGQVAFPNNGGTVEITHGALGGGTEQPVREVSAGNVQAVVPESLGVLYATAQRDLEAQAQAAKLLFEPATFAPNTELLAAEAELVLNNQPAPTTNLTVAANPPIGTQVDPANPVFEVLTTATFSALATPPGERIDAQIQTAITEKLASEGSIPRGMVVTLSDTGWHWDGTSLVIDVTLQPDGKPFELDAATRMNMLNALRGKDRAAAAAELDRFVQQGVISGFTLPIDVDEMPRNIQLIAEQPPGVVPRPTSGNPFAPAPTSAPTVAPVGQPAP